eukprot:scaffold6380_cov121-Isochrysis_galbana.AAC.3
MVKFNTLLALVSLAPTLVFVFIGLPELEPRRCLVSEGAHVPNAARAHAPRPRRVTTAAA